MAVARVTEVISSSKKGFQDAVEDAVKRASKTLRGITGAEVVRQQAKVENNKIVEYRVTVKILFLLDE